MKETGSDEKEQTRNIGPTRYLSADSTTFSFNKPLHVWFPALIHTIRADLEGVMSCGGNMRA